MASSRTDPFSWVGSTIDDKFRVEEVVGEGGFGVVYRAIHLGLGEEVAVKCLKIPASLPPEERERFHQSFLEEGRLLRKLSRATSSVVQALDVGAGVSPSGAWTPYLVLEWLRGETLEDWLTRREREGKRGMPIHEAAAILEPAIQALAMAHQDGIAHRDIKPANLFRNEAAGSPAMKVLDFGIAKVIAENATVTRALEQTGTMPSMFTPHYGAPEQFNRRFGATGPWTDVYALALVLTELSSGKPPLEGDDVTQLYIASADVSMRPTPRSRGVRTSHAVEEVFQKALAIEPRGRYLSATAFGEALREALLAPVEADAPGDEHLLPSTFIPEKPTTLDGAGLGKTSNGASGRRSALIGTVAALSLGMLGTAGYIAFTRSRPAISVPVVSRMGPELTQIELPTQPAQMILVPAGAFTMGHAKEGKTEKPAHTVTITKPFYLDRTEVSAEDYARCVAAKKCTASGVHGPQVNEADATKYNAFCTERSPQKARHPVNCVDREQAAAYCVFAGKRLPTEAEWEYAARGKDERLYPWGNEEPSCTMGNFARKALECTGRQRGTMEGGSFPNQKSAFGALDMAGNVWEWVADSFEPGAYTKEGRKDPLVSTGVYLGVLRGGSWDFAPSVSKATFRFAFDHATGHVSTGFRCAQTADEKP